MKVLVTGSGGMLGGAMMSALVAAGHEAIGVTRSDADLSVAGALDARVRAFAPEWIFNLAAFTKVDDCESRPDEAHRANADAPRHLAATAATHGAALLTVSTDYVFDGHGTRPYREDDPTGPRSVYGASKLAGEVAVRALLARHIIARTAWLYGEGGANFVDTILRRARAGEPLKVVDDQRGAPTWTVDLAPALIRLAAGGHAGTFHVTNSGDCTWHDLAQEVVTHAGIPAVIGRMSSAELTRPAPRPAYSVMSGERFEAATGTRLPHWRDAVHRYLNTQSSAAASASAVPRP